MKAWMFIITRRLPPEGWLKNLATRDAMTPDVNNLGFVESLFATYQRDRAAVPPEWQEYFDELNQGDGQPARFGPSFAPRSVFNPAGATDCSAAVSAASQVGEFQNRVSQLVRNYRVRGHIVARLDPLGLPGPVPPELDPAYSGFTEADLDRPVAPGTIRGEERFTLRGLVQRLRETYCRSIGVEYMFINDVAVRRWLQERMEPFSNRLNLTRNEQVRILTRLSDAVIFEEFIRRKFVGAKSFSLEGCESLIPLLDLAIERAREQGIVEIVLGMAHRGRLNVLANILGKSPRQIFREFTDADPDHYIGRGDVKYHLGHSNDWITSTGQKVHLSLCFNPSHLEYVNPVVLGRLRAKQDLVGDTERRKGLALLIHGDAAFAGEGIVQETLNLSQLAGYQVGGTLHVIINNQIGFTTGPKEGRSGFYCTSIARMLQSPILHVNGEDPEAVAQVIRLALDFRETFKRDVFIDMFGYRRLGHNESDEPSFTQPLLYRAIEERKPVREAYLEHLLALKGLTREEAEEIVVHRRELLERELSESRRGEYQPPAESLRGTWSGYTGGPDASTPDLDTGLPKEQLANLLEKQTTLPPGFHLHPKLQKFIESRRAMAHGELPLDWTAAESLALASLAVGGARIRFTGQDVGRGTFSQRHAVLVDYENGASHTPLQHLDAKQAPVEITNSPLSESGVLGFEYGYSLEYPNSLVLWEAQFGDFVNVAQPIVDQFITSAEEKWHRLSGLVMLLPHGFEGMGPEHSSARLERFLSLCADDNIQVVYPSTPAQYFHLLRRQVVRPWRKPLVVMTPKSLLRHAAAVSLLDELTRGTFRCVIPDEVAASRGSDTRRVLLCSGKIYYELLDERTRLKRDDIAIVRLEQFYPLHREELKAALTPYGDTTPVWWVQEEPENMGAWWFLRIHLGETLWGCHPLFYVARPATASPASGSSAAHKIEQRAIIDAAFSTETNPAKLRPTRAKSRKQDHAS